MKKKSLHIRQKLKKFVQTFLVIIIFALPLYTTLKWIGGIYGSGFDSRKVTTISPLNTRPIDQDRVLNPFDEPIISITFDDGWESIYSSAVPIMQKRGILSTQYIITGTYSDPLYMSKDQLYSLKNSGTEIGSHTVSHKDMTTLTDEELDYELESAKIALEADFGGAQDFASPLGSYNARTIQAIKQYYRSHKNAEGDPAANELQAINIAESFDLHNIKSYSIRSTTTDEDIQKLINSAIKHNAWLVLTYHRVDSNPSLYTVTPEVFERQMSIVSGNPIKSSTVGRFIDNWESKP